MYLQHVFFDRDHFIIWRNVGLGVYQSVGYLMDIKESSVNQ